METGVLFETRAGAVRLRWNDRGLTAIEMPEMPPRELRAQLGRENGKGVPGFVQDAARLLKRHLAGEQQDLAGLQLDLSVLAPFQRAVYEKVRSLPPGRTASYGEIAAMLGIELPVKPLRRMLIPTEPFADFPHTAPMIIDMSNGFHFRPEALGFLLAWNDPEENTFGYNTDFDPAFIEKVLTRAADRVPCFENLAVNPKRAWAGLYEMTPDHHAIVGRVPELPGFFLANGFSGHGVMHAPATGKILSDLILHGHTDVADVHKLRLSRFAEGDLIHETALL